MHKKIKKKQLKKLVFLFHLDRDGKTYDVYRYKRGKLHILMELGKIVESRYVEDKLPTTLVFKGKEYKYHIYAYTPEYTFYEIEGKKWLVGVNHRTKKMSKFRLTEVQQLFKKG